MLFKPLDLILAKNIDEIRNIADTNIIISINYLGKMLFYKYNSSITSDNIDSNNIYTEIKSNVLSGGWQLFLNEANTLPEFYIVNSINNAIDKYRKLSYIKNYGKFVITDDYINNPLYYSDISAGVSLFHPDGIYLYVTIDSSANGNGLDSNNPVYIGNINFDFLNKFGKKIFLDFLNANLPNNYTLNINVPNCELEILNLALGNNCNITLCAKNIIFANLDVPDYSLNYLTINNNNTFTQNVAIINLNYSGKSSFTIQFTAYKPVILITEEEALQYIQGTNFIPVNILGIQNDIPYFTDSIYYREFYKQINNNNIRKFKFYPQYNIYLNVLYNARVREEIIRDSSGNNFYTYLEIIRLDSYKFGGVSLSLTNRAINKTFTLPDYIVFGIHVKNGTINNTISLYFAGSNVANITLNANEERVEYVPITGGITNTNFYFSINSTNAIDFCYLDIVGFYKY